MWANFANISGMTPELRAALRTYLKRHHISQADLADQLGTDRHTINRALSHNGKVPVIWQQMLDALGLELVLQVKKAA